MNLLKKAKKLGAKLQKDDAFIEFSLAKQKMEADDELQKNIEKFNLKKIKINYEISQNQTESEKIDSLNNDIKELYEKISKNPNMMNFNAAKEKLTNLVQKIVLIISASADGNDPYDEQAVANFNYSGCATDCSTCGGCG
jgi:cell fate (sporulation/competence/biofilm development) regulator YlbF (YheA/YmcA/DUF963 family)